MLKYKDTEAEILDSMPMDTFLHEVARVQIPSGCLSHLSTAKALSVPPGPSLRTGQKNRVVVYCGAFNPPHTGHIACLVDALQHVAEDPELSDFVACIIVALDHELLLQKEERKRADKPSASPFTTPITLSGKDRADLLSSYIQSVESGLDAQLRAKVHVWAPGRAKTLVDIPRVLAAEAKNQCFDMDFILLRSCEYLYYGDKGAARCPRAIHPQCSMVIFTNIGGRKNDVIWQSDGNLRPLEAPWTKWQALVMDEDARESVRRTVWSTKSPTSEQRMLDTRSTLKSEAGFSSTRIRKLLHASDFNDREELEEQLHEAGAINARKLIFLLGDWADQKDTTREQE